MYWGTGTHPGAFVCVLGLFYSSRVLEFIHVSLELLDVLGTLPILAQLIPEQIDERLEPGFQELVVMTSTGMELRCRTNRQRVVRWA